MSAPYATSATPEQRALFNPAFISVLAHACATGFLARAERGMPLPYFYLSLPIALHARDRQVLPGTTGAYMSAWIRGNPEVLAGFPSRVRSLRAIISQGLVFSLRHQALAAANDGLAPRPLRRRPKLLQPTEDWSGCVKAASFMGRWLGSQQTDTASTLALWGLRP
ncbi:three component ABC system middle component [Geodermatophilus amargosae]|uniref:three component ABC system middle component n=1 Tax=Geodermatophilus amargosae TaxID=1296565 RepID=UPI0034DE9906